MPGTSPPFFLHGTGISRRSCTWQVKREMLSMHLRRAPTITTSSTSHQPLHLTTFNDHPAYRHGHHGHNNHQHDDNHPHLLLDSYFILSIRILFSATNVSISMVINAVVTVVIAIVLRVAPSVYVMVTTILLRRLQPRHDYWYYHYD